MLDVFDTCYETEMMNKAKQKLGVFTVTRPTLSKNPDCKLFPHFKNSKVRLEGSQSGIKSVVPRQRFLSSANT